MRSSCHAHENSRGKGRNESVAAAAVTSVSTCAHGLMRSGDVRNGDSCSIGGYVCRFAAAGHAVVAPLLPRPLHRTLEPARSVADAVCIRFHATIARQWAHSCARHGEGAHGMAKAHSVACCESVAVSDRSCRDSIRLLCSLTRRNAVQHVATRRNAVQHVATRVRRRQCSANRQVETLPFGSYASA